MTLCLKRWKMHVRFYWTWPFVIVNRGGICMCDINKELGK